MPTSDPLYFLAESTRNINATAGIDAVGYSGSLHINPFQYIFSLGLVIVGIYLVFILLRFLMGQKNRHQSHLLRELTLSPTFKIYYVKLGKKLYLLAALNNSLSLLDIIKDEK
jgi:hypothetical protein